VSSFGIFSLTQFYSVYINEKAKSKNQKVKIRNQKREIKK